MLSGCCGLRPYTLDSQTSILDIGRVVFPVSPLRVCCQQKTACCRTACATTFIWYSRCTAALSARSHTNAGKVSVGMMPTCAASWGPCQALPDCDQALAGDAVTWQMAEAKFEAADLMRCPPLHCGCCDGSAEPDASPPGAKQLRGGKLCSAPPRRSGCSPCIATWGTKQYTRRNSCSAHPAALDAINSGTEPPHVRAVLLYLQQPQVAAAGAAAAPAAPALLGRDRDVPASPRRAVWAPVHRPPRLAAGWAGACNPVRLQPLQHCCRAQH